MKLEPVVLQKDTASETKAAAVARDFEGLLLGQLLRTMRQTVEAMGGEQADTGKATFASMLDTCLAQACANAGGFGLAADLAKELSAPQVFGASVDVSKETGGKP